MPEVRSDLRILTVGERRGGLSAWLALQGYPVIYSDVHEPHGKALTLHQKLGVSDLIKYEQVDVFRMPYPDNSLDAVVCKSVIGGLKLVYSDRSTRTLENQKKACEEIRRVLKPGGVFLGAENLRGSPLHWYFCKRKGLDKGWRYLTLGELQFLFDGYTRLQLKPFGFLPSSTPWPLLNALAGKMNDPLSLLLPDSWQYIAFIAAVK